MQKRGFFPANCEEVPMKAFVLNKYWHDNEDDQYEVVAYLSEDFLIDIILLIVNLFITKLKL